MQRSIGELTDEEVRLLKMIAGDKTIETQGKDIVGIPTDAAQREREILEQATANKERPMWFPAPQLSPKQYGAVHPKEEQTAQEERKEEMIKIIYICDICGKECDEAEMLHTENHDVCEDCLTEIIEQHFEALEAPVEEPAKEAPKSDGGQ